MKSHLLLLFLFSSSYLFAQDSENPVYEEVPDEIALDFSLFYTPVLSRDFFGFSMDIKYYPQQKWATGLSFSAASRKIDESFSYAVSNPGISYFEVGWINQFDIIQKKNFRVGLQFTNGLALVSLRDHDIVEETWDEFGMTESTKRVATNSLYILQPGIETSIKVFDNNRFPDVYVTAEAKYRKAFGGTKFGKPGDFTNYYVGIGISLIGFVTN